MNWKTYFYRNLITGEMYVGGTGDEKHRKACHMYRARTPKDPRGHLPLYKAIRKYGIKNFEYDVISSHHTKEAMLKAEKKLIIKLQPAYNTIGKKK